MTLQQTYQAERTTHIPQWTMGERLAKARRDERLEQEDMAREFGVSASTISSWEKDISQPRHFMRVMAAWADKTQVPLGWLLGTDEPPRSKCDSVIDLRELPGSMERPEVYQQGTFRHLTIV